MKKICLIGPVDKRVLAYPLLKILDLTGKTLVVTDDSNFRKFSDNYSMSYSIGRADVRIVNNINSDDFDIKSLDLSVKLDEYDYILYITTNELISGCDSVVYCHSLNKAMCTEDVLSVLEGVEHKDVTITTGVIKEKGILSITLDKNSLKYIWCCEETKLLCECKDANICKSVAYLFSEVLGVSKDSLIKTLGRKE